MLFKNSLWSTTNRVKWNHPTALMFLEFLETIFALFFEVFKFAASFYTFFETLNYQATSIQCMMFPRGTEVHLPPLIFASTLEVSKFAASSFLKLWIFRQPQSQGGQRFAPTINSCFSFRGFQVGSLSKLSLTYPWASDSTCPQIENFWGQLPFNFSTVLKPA